MSFENVKKYFEEIEMDSKIIELKDSSATVEQAANALGCKPEHIAKTMSFKTKEGPILIVCAGDAKIDNKKYKSVFGKKAKMIPANEVEELIGHLPGGVCPFAIKENVKVYLDVSLKRFEKVYPAAGNGHSAIELTIKELETISKADSWVDVCNNWQVDQ
ncbi:EbsC protein [Erysipelatoclostridium sp. An173]|uniref:YbaK/EbsC family protein n=1 Tax=Erysipelatoclostridium sp. An173 TaxID=1965571 RepID=UPI000B39DF9A|nr:YbaK/EbsC family protein [Erysipelatoclostridium sp. An173]OUP73812.1 EbsC protein [Erysipelatoclostridium sp. An173]